jgi:chlorophyll(ide) b reductase
MFIISRFTMRSTISAIFVTLALPALASAFTSPSLSGRQVSSSNAFFRVSSESSSGSMMLAMSAGGVVITGSAGGVGFAYAGEFMDRGYDVVICDVKDCTQAAKALAARHKNGNVYHTKCDVSDNASVVKLGQFAKNKLGTINYWINNAGVNGGRRPLKEVSPSQVEMVVKVNLLGILLCTKVAMDILAEQVSWFRQSVFLISILCMKVTYAVLPIYSLV